MNVCIFDNLTHPLSPTLRHQHFQSIALVGHPKHIDLGEKAVCIGDDVWIAAGAMVLRGVKIGRAAIIGAGAVVGAVAAKKTSTETTTGNSETRSGPIYLIVGTARFIPLWSSNKVPIMTTAEEWLHRIRGAIALIDRTS